MRRIGIIHYIVLLFIIALWTLWLVFTAKSTSAAVQTIQVGYASTRWPSTEGIILISSFYERHNRRSGVSYVRQFEYEYNVDGRWLRSQRYRIDDLNFARRADAEAFVQEYSVGKSVTVYYNPVSPNAAVLRTGVEPNDIIGLLASLSLLLLSITIVVTFSWLLIRHGTYRLSANDQIN